MRRKFSDLKRRKQYIAERRRFILICEGEKTEPAYFEALKSQYPYAQIAIEYVAPAGVPITIKDKAKRRMAELKAERRRNPSAKNDQIWAVFDRDEHKEVANAIAGCEGAGAQVAYSNPCFEVWLILHHLDYQAGFDAADDRHQVQKRYQKVDPTYDPNGGKKPNCEVLMPRVEAAENLAEIQYQRRVDEGAPLGRPCTTVYKLTRAIRTAAEAAKPKRL